MDYVLGVIKDTHLFKVLVIKVKLLQVLGWESNELMPYVNNIMIMYVLSVHQAHIWAKNRKNVQLRMLLFNNLMNKTK